MNNQFKLKCLWSALGVLIIVLIIALVVTNKKGAEEKKDESAPEETINEAENEGVVDSEKEPELLALAAEDEIHQLIVSYIDAAYTKADIKLLEGIMDSVEKVDVAVNETYLRYIEAYEDITCYVLEGKDDINVVFVTYMIKLNNFDTLLPGAESVKVRLMEDGTYKIHNAQVGEALQDYITDENEVLALEALKKKIQSEYNAVIESDSELKAIVDIMNGAKNQ